MKVFGNLRRSTSNTGTKSKFKETVIAYISLNFVQKDEEERIKEILKQGGYKRDMTREDLKDHKHNQKWIE